MPSLFATRRHHSKAAVSKILRQLLENGWIQVQISTSDGRQRKYHLTDTGKAKLEIVNERREKAIKTVWMSLDESELKQWIQLNDTLIRKLESF